MGPPHLMAYLCWQALHVYFCAVGLISNLSVIIYSGILYHYNSDLSLLAIFLLSLLAFFLHFILLTLIFYKQLHIKYLNIASLVVFLGSSIFQALILFAYSLCENFQNFCIMDCCFLFIALFNGVSIAICYPHFLQNTVNRGGFIFREEVVESTNVSNENQEN